MKLLRAATLLEALVSLILISIVLGVLFFVYSQVANYESERRFLDFDYKADSLFYNLRENRNNYIDTIYLSNYKVSLLTDSVQFNSSYRHLNMTFWKEGEIQFYKQYLIETEN